MNILVISPYFPMPDRMGGDTRFFCILRLLAADHQISYVAFDPQKQIGRYGHESVEAYKGALLELGIKVLAPGVRPALQRGHQDIVIFQYSFSKTRLLDEVRAFLPEARVLIDNGDVAYRRLFSKADHTRRPEDRAAAEKCKEDELAIYRAADAILAVSEDDLRYVREDIPDLRGYLIPTVHAVSAVASGERSSNLIFVGSFLHEPNVDAVIWFVKEILPLIAAARPGVKLQVVGYGPPPEILALASDEVEIVGYVPSTAPYLHAAAVSIAPVRFGAGVKGKIGEAMAFRLPVVTTSVGIDGFGLTPNVNVLVGDTAQLFAEQVIGLLTNEELRIDIGNAGFQFIETHFSEAAIQKRVHAMMESLPALPVRRSSPLKTMPLRVDAWLDKNIRWRLGTNS